MVGFPDHVKDDTSARLREAGYTVLIEQAFELNPPKRETEKIQTLQQVVDKFFGTDCESAETEGGTWKLAITDGDKVGELFYGGDPVCGIYNRSDTMEIELYRELTTFPALLRTAMLEHNPDKPWRSWTFSVPLKIRLIRQSTLSMISAKRNTVRVLTSPIAQCWSCVYHTDRR